MNEKRTAKLLDENGNWIEIPIEELGLGPIIHEELSEELLERIRKVYSEIKEFLNEPLETFEIAFMRDENPENEVDLWECIVDTYGIVKAMTQPQTQEERVSIFNTIIAMSVNALTVEEEAQAGIAQIRKVFNTICKKLTKDKEQE